MSARDLWQFITGSSLSKPKQLVGEEIAKNAERLKNGLKHYKVFRKPAGEFLKKEKKLDTVTVEFVKKLSQFLSLDEAQSYELYRLYMSREYRGSASELQNSLTVDRHTQTLLSKFRDHYYNERLCLLRSIKHMLAYWQEEKHPFHSQYNTFVQKLYKSADFTQNILQQYDQICEALAPSWETHGKYMNDQHGQIWVVQNLREQCELLEILVLYYSGAELRPPSLLDLANKFKRQGFGRRQTNRHLLEEHAEPLLHRISFLQVVLLIEGLDLEDLMVKHKNETVREHHVVKHEKFELLDQYFESLGRSVEHGPLLLAWAAVRELSGNGEEMKTAALGNKALSVKVFPFIVSRLKMEPFCGKSVTAKLCYTIMYGLMSSVLEAFHHDTLGDREGLQDVAAILLKQSVLAEDFWKLGMESGLGPLFQLSCSYFPLDLGPLLELCISLSQAGPNSAQKVIKVLQNMGIYTEVMSNSSDVKATKQQHIWQLMKDRRPYHASGSDLTIPRGALGEYHQVGNSGIVQWQCEFDSWDVFVGELNMILQQIAHGQGMVQVESIQRVSSICRLIHTLLSANRNLIHISVLQVAALTPLIYQVIQRFSQVHPPPLELLSACIQCVHQLALNEPVMSWRKLQQTNLLPNLTENIDNLAEVSSGSGLNAGIYGLILAGTECTHGQYPLTIAILDLISALIVPLSRCGEIDLLLASVMFVTREIFPVFSKWRYCNITRREAIGQKCLEIFHKVLNILVQDKPTSDKVSVRQACIYSLLYTEAGRALLDIVATSVDTVNSALASQGNAMEGAGIELIQMIRTAFSVLNRLLLLRPPGARQSPVEHSLSAQGSGVSGKRNAMATIAQYIYHRHDPRLATLATVLLKRLAMIFPMSILACLGDEAEPIRDVFLSRLQAQTEDIRLKVVILEFLSTCVDTQPGLIEIFLNVKSLSKTPVVDNAKRKIDEKGPDQNLAVGKVSCLQTVLSLVEDKKQGTYECPSQLLCAAIEFIHALWHGHRETAMVALRKMPGFWHSVCLSLTRELQSAAEADSDLQVLQKEVRSCADIMKILALELYHSQGSGLDDNLKNVLSDILSKGRLLYWSQYLCESLHWSSVQDDAPIDWSENSTLQLLYAWRNLMLVLSNVSSKVKSLNVPNTAQEKILSDILSGLQHQFSSDREVTRLNIKLASVSSAFYLTLLKHWVCNLDCWTSMLHQIEEILGRTMACCETLIPSVQIGLLGALSLILQHIRQSQMKPPGDKDLASLVPIICSLIQQSTYQLPAPTHQTLTKTQPSTSNNSQSSIMHMSLRDDTSLSSTSMLHNTQNMSISRSEGPISRSADQTMNQNAESSSNPEVKSNLHKDIEVKLKLQTSGLCLLEELVSSLPPPEYWLPEVKQYSLLQTLLASIESWINVQQGAEYVHTVFMLLLTLSKHPQGAEALAVGSFIQQLCLIISQLYSQPEPVSTHSNSKHKGHSNTGASQPPSWSSIYCLSISLYTAILDSLKYNFLKYALEFVGVHQDRMHQCLSSAGVLLHHDILEEATRTCQFVSELSVYRREWRLQLPQVLQKLMTDVCMMLQTSVSSLIRPNLLQHVLERQKRGQDIVQVLAQDKYLSAPFIRSMSQQPDDSDHPSQEVMVIQNRLLTIVCQCLISLRKFSPDLCEIVMDQSLDISEYESFLQIGFSMPSAEHDMAPSFGTLVSCISLCLFLLNKVDPRGPGGTPPAKHDTDKSPIDRGLIMFVLENALYLIMSQAIRCLKDPSLHSREKQLIKRELSAELNSFLSGMQRYLRRGSGAHTPSSSHQTVASISAETSYMKLIDIFVRKVLR